MSFKFKTEDFDYRGGGGYQALADQANHILQAHLDTLSKVYAKQDNRFHLNTTFFKVVDKEEDATHVCLLWDPQLIEKKEHECRPLASSVDGVVDVTGECGECGNKLKAKWEVVQTAGPTNFKRGCD